MTFKAWTTLLPSRSASLGLQAQCSLCGSMGPVSNMISTNRHTLSNDDATLTVTDRGFGNVLDGLEFNETATALLGEQAVVLSLEGAASAVQAFRACTRSLRV